MKKIQMLAKPKLKQDLSVFWLNTRTSFNKNEIISGRFRRPNTNANKIYAQNIENIRKAK